jgi:predicted house-cleaning noncanonical NTP pyrophosphatase (MazG superfamily)
MSYKLVRNNHRELLQDKLSGLWRISPDPAGVLVRKIGEEYGEFAENRDPSEIYDLYDILDELSALLDPDGEFAEKHQVKLDRMGDFSDHLEWTPLSVAWDDATATPLEEQ